MSASELTIPSTVEISDRKVQVIGRLGRGTLGISYLVRYEDGIELRSEKFGTAWTS